MLFVALGSPLELWECGERLPLGPVKQRCVLTVLLHARSEPVAVDTLAARVWGEDPPPKPLDSLHTYLSRLRRLLARAVGERAQIEHPAPRFYQLNVDPDDVDLHRFQRLRAQAAASEDRRVAIALLSTAESLHRGEAFAEFTSDWAMSVRARLEEELRRVREERIRLELELGHHADLLGELHQLAAQHPSGQAIIGQLMTALYRCGRTDEALERYRDTRRRLLEWQGIEPGAELRALHQRILEQDASLLHSRESGKTGTARDDGAHADHGAAARHAAHPEHGVHAPDAPDAPDAPSAAEAAHRADDRAPRATMASKTEYEPPQRRDSLPRAARDFVGRRSELALLLAEARDPHPGYARTRDDAGGPRTSHPRGDGRDGGGALPLTVIHGMPGVGKTALAVRAAHNLSDRYPAGAFYVDLRGYSDQPPRDPAEVLSLLLRDAHAPHDPDTTTLDELVCRWREWTALHPVLLVLDDASDIAQIRPLLPGASTCKVIVTSRKRFTALEGADSIPLDVLPTSDAAQLFTRIVGAARVPDATALHRAVGTFGGHPFSIQLLASRFLHRESWDLHHLADKMAQTSDPLGELEDDIVSLAFRLSYAGLGLDARRVFRRLALHPGPDLTTEGAAALAGLGETETRRAVSMLLDHHLLDEPVRDRYAPHDLARAFGRQVCEEEDAPDEREAAWERLMAYYLTTADRADRSAHPRRRRLPLPGGFGSALAHEFADPEAASVWLSVERSNLLAVARDAARRGSVCAGLFPHVLAQALKLWGAWGDAVRLHTAAVAAYAAPHPTGRAQALVELADVLAQESYEKALTHATEAADLFAATGDEQGRAAALFQCGRAHLAAGRRPEALKALAASLRLYRACGDEQGEAEVLNVEGVALHYAGAYADALVRFRRVFEIHETALDSFGEATALNNIGEIYCLEGKYGQARHYYEQALTRVRRVGGRLDIALVDGNLGAVHQATGDTERALACYQRALSSYRMSGDSAGEADTLIRLAEACAASGRPVEALTHYRAAEEVATGAGNAYERQRAISGLADVRRVSGQLVAARAAYHQALGVARDIGFALGVANALDGLVRTEIVFRNWTLARSYGDEALGLYQELEAHREARLLRQLLNDAGGTRE